MQRRTVVLVDDLDNKTTDAATVTFGLDGKVYEIELGHRNEEKLRKFLAPYIEAARPVAGRKRSPRRRPPT